MAIKDKKGSRKRKHRPNFKGKECIYCRTKLRNSILCESEKCQREWVTGISAVARGLLEGKLPLSPDD